MSCRIICYTLFDVTFSEINIRAKPTSNIEDWVKKRNSRCNFDTIQQLISLRSQPEIIVYPKLTHDINPLYFGTKHNIKNIHGWKFIFQVQHARVFDQDDEKLKFLYRDCHNIPMLIVGTEINNLYPMLDTSIENKNIHFDYE